MAAPELILHFATPEQLSVAYQDADSGPLPFANPVMDKDREDIAWYLETYGVQSLDEPDDREAARIEGRLAEIGKALFDAVFANDSAKRLFYRFQDAEDHHRVLTIDSPHAAILALPWELLRDPQGVYLIRERPHISVRRRIPGVTGGREAYRLEPKPRLHLLFLVSRPDDAGFIDPRSDPQAVLDALETQAPGRVTWEFLRPATLDALHRRLNDETLPAIDILHFDGHGVFSAVDEDTARRHPERFGRDILRQLADERQARGAPAAAPVNMGFLVFENENADADGGSRLLSAGDLGDNLHRARIGLVVLSACQGAKLHPDGDPLASVAGRLTGAGIPAILAMTHSVLVATTRGLFGQFYASLARGRGIAAALDDARAWLANHPERHEVRRGGQVRKLRLQDWFLPALFQGGADAPLFSGEAAGTPPAPIHNLRPAHEAGFFGRQRELWDIERWFAADTRRISLTGFGGQGKTELALEAGRWLLRAGLFRRAVWIDFAQVQTADALGVAVSTLASVLSTSLIDADAAKEALVQEPTLVILDNLETLAPEPLVELLDAAVAWSRVGTTRILLTSRNPEFPHADYRVQGTRVHRRIPLKGLGSAARPDDALAWYAALARLPGADDAPRVPPPRREELVELFDRVAFHPLSIAVLAQQLRSRTPKQLGERLEQLLAGGALSAIAEEGTPPSLLASLRLSLDRLIEAERQAVGRLGVFQGGALESELLAITGLGEWGEQGIATGSPWPALRRQLEAAALIEAEALPGVMPPYLRFHPSLAPLLWAGLGAAEQARLDETHRHRYYQLANTLYREDNKTPDQARAIARRELPNLLRALDRALAAGGEDAAVFVVSVNRFLTLFGRRREAADLARRAEQAAGEPGSRAWYLAQSGRGEQLLAVGQVGQAMACFAAIRDALGEAPSYELALTLARLGRCQGAAGRPDLAEAHYRRGIAVTEALEPGELVLHQQGQLLADLGDVLMIQGRYGAARAAYEASLAIKGAGSGDPRGEGAVLFQLGTLALEEGNRDEALRRYQEALALFRRLQEPASEAIILHQIGMLHQKAGHWPQAEQQYREAAALKERLGDLAGAAGTWNQLAMVCESSGRPEAAEGWYRRAIAAYSENSLNRALTLNNLADLLRQQPGRLAEARPLAEAALSIKLTLDPGAAEIWTTYNILAEIAEGQGQPQEAAGYRRQAREARRRFAGTAHDVRRFAPLIAALVDACGGHEQARARVEEVIQQGLQAGGEDAEFAQALQRLLAGERDAEALCERLSFRSAPVIEATLAALADPDSLQTLLAQTGDPA